MKSATLEEILTRSEVREAKLIGYDETPSSRTVEFGCLESLEESDSVCDAKDYRLKCHSPSRPTELPLACNSPEIRLSKPIQSNICRTDTPLTANPSNGSSIDSNGKGTLEVSDSSVFRFYCILRSN